MKADLQTTSGSTETPLKQPCHPVAPHGDTVTHQPPSMSRNPSNCVSRRITPPSPSRHPYRQADKPPGPSSVAKTTTHTSPPRRRPIPMKTGPDVKYDQKNGGRAQPYTNMVIEMSTDLSSAPKTKAGPSRIVAPDVPSLSSTEGNKAPVATSEISLSLEQTKVLENVLAG